MTDDLPDQPNDDGARSLAEGIVDTIREPLLVLHEDLRVKSANRAFYAAFEVERAETEGHPVYELGDGQWDIPELRRLLDELLPDNESFEDFEVEHEFERIGRRTMLLNARRIDHLQLILLAIADITERKRAEVERELLVGELNHRVKNLLAVVRALAAQGDGDRSAAEYREVFIGRLDALMRAHELALESQWRGTDLRTLAGHTLEPYTSDDRPEAVEVDGVPVELDPRQALSLSLVLHELATNAVKYGALSAPAGRVRLAWRVARAGAGRRLDLEWAERGGPPVTPPREGGFGTRLIERAFGYELNGEAGLDFRP